MKGKIFIAAIIGLVVLVATIWYFSLYSTRPEVAETSQDSTANSQKKPSETSEDNKFANLKGDKFDEAYLADMLAHHEGAVNVAEQAQAATRQENIRSLAVNITSTQSREMFDMRQWQQAWGYEATNNAGHNSHSGDGADMSGDMVQMQNSLSGLTGEAFDKEFLKQMIVHHQQAVEMSQYADTNAKHQEVKDLARNVIATQNSEINQMKQWQDTWGY